MENHTTLANRTQNYKIDADKIKTLQDVIVILRLLDLSFELTDDNNAEYESIKHLLTR